jgi:hypothetical protein
MKMRILFEVLERDRFEIYDPCIPAAAETAKIIAESATYDTLRILKFCPATLAIIDMTAEMYEEYRGDHSEDAPLWVKLQSDFDIRAAEEAKDARDWQRHVKSLSRAA